MSVYGDIYSYGVLLLEMITGKRPTDDMFEGDLNLHNFAKKAFPKHVLKIVDPVLVATGEANDKADMMSDESLVITSSSNSSRTEIGNFEECVTCLIKIGLSCSMELPQDRIEMTHVISELCSIRKILHRNYHTR